MVSKIEELQARAKAHKEEMERKRKELMENTDKASKTINEADNLVVEPGVIDENIMVKSEDFVEKIKNSKEPMVFDEASQYASWTDEDGIPKRLRPEKLKELNDAIEVLRKPSKKLITEVSKEDSKEKELERRKAAKKLELEQEYESLVKNRRKEYDEEAARIKEELKQDLKDNHDDYSPSDIREARESKKEELQELEDDDGSYSSNTTDITISDFNFNPSGILKTAIIFIGVGITMIVGYQVYNAVTETISMDQSFATNMTSVGDVMGTFPLGMMFILLLGPIVIFQLIKGFYSGRY